MTLIGKYGVIENVEPVLPAAVMYGGEVTVRFEPRSHRYEVCDKALGENWFHVPSVTRVLSAMIDKSEPLVAWATKKSRETLVELIKPSTTYPAEDIQRISYEVQDASRNAVKRSCDIGHEAHSWVERYLGYRGGFNECPAPPSDPPVRSACSAARKFILEHDVRPAAVERILYSRKHEVIGTTDFAGAICRISDRPSILDWKSSESIDHSNYDWQLAAYAMMWEEMTGRHIEDRWLVRLDKKDSTAYPKRLPPETLLADWSAFLGLLRAHKRLIEMESN